MEKKKLFTRVEEGVDPVITAGENILYLILIDAEYKQSDRETYRTWEFIVGRQKTYDYIKDLLTNERDDSSEVIIDMDKSKIYAENPLIKDSKLKLTNGVSLYTFMKDAYTLHKVEDDSSFDIEDYHYTDEDTSINDAQEI